MLTIVLFHLLMLVLGLSIGTGIVRQQLVSDLLGYLHNTIGITTPSPDKVKMIALIWIGSLIIIVDGCIFLLVSITRLSNSG
jgi:hypothetical protein